MIVMLVIIYAVKTKVLISCAVTVQMICAFVFAYAKCRFSYDLAHTTVVLINVDLSYIFTEEDTYGSYGRLLLKYFCAEAVMTGHALLLSSLDYDAQQLLKVGSTISFLTHSEIGLEANRLDPGLDPDCSYKSV